ncbi:MAG: family 78 glycoside hydrolase catalytic domain [Kiritimatiellaeota bacterium]|nr:family 78 glycoside hydrolase catalytic domain [Kiritimatiellota bacterium]
MNAKDYNQQKEKPDLIGNFTFQRKYRRVAEWVWRPRDLAARATTESRVQIEKNRFVYFRKTFELAGKVKQACADVSADGRYILFVNGQRVGRGPARCSPEWQSYDTYDLRPFLRPGRNIIAALVHSYGRDTGWYELPRWEAASAFGCGGWFLQGVVMAGNEVRLDTGDTWRCLLSEAWQQDTVNGITGFAEELDARKIPAGWMMPEFDDSAWPRAQILRVSGIWGSNDVVPFPVMAPRDIPFPMEEIHRPATVSVGEVVNVAGTLEQAFSAEILLPLSQCRVENVESMINGKGFAVIATSFERSASIVFDFGRTQQGRVCFSVDGPAGAVLDIRYSERLKPDGRVEVPPWSWGDNSYVQTHRVILPGGPFDWEQFDFGGFRYVQFTIRGCAESLQLKCVAVNFTSYPVGDRGRFSCSDPLLDKIYSISAYTLQCCMLDSYEDCPSREQSQWTNDQYVHLNVNYAQFGDTALARRLIRQVGQSQRPDGQVMMVAPGYVSAQTRQNMSEFTLHWIMSFAPYVLYTGDDAILREFYPNIIKGLSWAEQHLNNNDLLDNVPGILWIDWAEIDKKGELTEINCRFVGCLRIAVDIAERLGIAYDAKRYRVLADRISTAVNRLLWDDKRGVYIDTRHNGIQSRRVSQQCNVAAMYFAVAPRERWDRMLAYILDEKRLVMTNAAGVYGNVPFNDEHDVVLSHAFYMHFLHAVLDRVGRHDVIVKNMLNWWGPQAKANVSTWAEAWNTEPIHTLCHAFMCTPGYDLPTYVLGVRPLADGFTRFAVMPQTCGLTSACGVFPSVRGDISVAWKLAETTFELTVEVPANTEARLSLPNLKLRPTTITLDGSAVKGITFVVGSGSHRLAVKGK